MSREAHVRFCERVRATSLVALALLDVPFCQYLVIVNLVVILTFKSEIKRPPSKNVDRLSKLKNAQPEKHNSI